MSLIVPNMTDTSALTTNALQLIPISVAADGDCLPHVGSVFAFGHKDYAEELRVRITVELAAHDNLHLYPNHLRKSCEMSDPGAKLLLNNLELYFLGNLKMYRG